MYNSQQDPQVEAQQARLNAPSLNVITNFSRRKQAPLHGYGPSIQERRQQQQQRESSSPAVNPISALSPSDRTLVIGISLQPETPSIHIIQDGDDKPYTPAIAITPAEPNANLSWKERNWRPRSSMYSQATRLSRTLSAGQIPPVPRLPRQDLYLKKARPVSAISWHTDFSEEDEREIMRQSISGQNRSDNVRGVDIELFHQKPEGWWNTMLSPIFGRSNTLSKKTGRPLSAEEPQTPWARQLLQPERSLDQNQTAHTRSIQEELERPDAQRQTLAFFSHSPLDTKRPVSPIQTLPITPEITQEGGFGLASEYYEGSWHDAYSPTRFFECQGHDCSQKVMYRHGKIIGGPDAGASLPGLTEKNLASVQSTFPENSVDLVQPMMATRDIAIQEHSITPAHIRNDSVETVIENIPDARSQFNESRPAISSTAGSPIPRMQDVFDSKALTMSKTPTSLSKASAEILSGSRLVEASPVVRKPEQRRHIPESRGRDGEQILSKPCLKAPLSRKEATSTNPTTKNLPLEDPFHDIYRCDSPMTIAREQLKETSPRKPVAKSSMITATPASVADSSDPMTRHDVLNIDAPRKAPSPPRGKSPQNTLYAQTSVSRSALGILVDENTEIKRGRNELSPVPYYPPSQEKVSMQQGNSSRRSSSEFTLSDPKSEYPAKVALVSKKEKKRGCLVCCLSNRDEKDGNRAKRKWYFLIGGALLALVILIVVLVLTFTLHRSDAPVQTTWLNITGFPPIPTGIATIAQPEAAIEESRCVAPNTLWSCAVPKEQQTSIAPNSPDQPNFRLEIRFQNGSSILNSNTSLSSRSLSNVAKAKAYVRDQILQTRDPFTTSLFSPSPPPPSQEDQIFLGNTTDNNTAPFQGQATPFFISFLPITTSDATKLLATRDNTDTFPNVTAGIPPPSINPDGTAVSANLLPFPSAQPLMLYNRGRDDEHYGFYTYFDRSIFLKSTDLLNSTGPDIPDNSDGGALESAADVRCTWAQTRFLVQIWTNAGNALRLLSANSTTFQNSSNSATNFNQPGSFPYPVSITLDRHGGDERQKMIYCYGMDETEHIISSAKQVHLEKRDFGGQGLINPGNRLFGAATNVSIADGGPGGIDGGFGGCRCQWRNWIET